jgi:hypothetical protein
MAEFEYRVTDAHIAGLRADLQRMPTYRPDNDVWQQMLNRPSFAEKHLQGVLESQRDYTRSALWRCAEQVIANSGKDVVTEFNRLTKLAEDNIGSVSPADRDKGIAALRSRFHMMKAAERAILQKDPTLEKEFPRIKSVLDSEPQTEGNNSALPGPRAASVQPRRFSPPA